MSPVDDQDEHPNDDQQARHLEDAQGGDDEGLACRHDGTPKATVSFMEAVTFAPMHFSLSPAGNARRTYASCSRT
jgi:hypothetical protein